jgi:hypothetical protein
MTQHDLLALIEEGVQNGRIAPHLAAYIAAEMRERATEATPDDTQGARATLMPTGQRPAQC